MDITEENKAKKYYINSDIDGLHTPARNTVELNQHDLFKLMHGYAQEQKLPINSVCKRTSLIWKIVALFGIGYMLVDLIGYFLPD